MIDHVLGRPSIKSRRLQVLAVVAFWTTYLVRGNKHGPPGAQRLFRVLYRRFTAWQMVLLTMLYVYATRNFSTLVGLASPDPLTNMYDATFYRATWVLTALDAGFWTAMKIQTGWLREMASIVFSVYYLVAAEKADEKVRKVRGNLTVEHLRVSWNKGLTPYLRLLQGLACPRQSRWPPRLVRIPRPATSDYHDQPILAWLYYDGSIDSLCASGLDKVILDIPGGGFVSMGPRCNDERLFSWAVKTGLPVLSLDYKKAPEHPFPYALNECYDAYATLLNTRGRCIGMAAHSPLRVVVTGDSAGGNLASAMTLMLSLQSAPVLPPGQVVSSANSGDKDPWQLPLPEGLVLMYPCLDVNIGSWMSDEQMALIRDRSTRATNRNVLRRKTKQYSDIAGTPGQSDDETLMTEAVASHASGNIHHEANDADAAADDEGADRSQFQRARTPKPAYSHVNRASYSQMHASKAADKHTELALAQSSAAFSAETRGTHASSPHESKVPTASYHPRAISTQLATASTISYFNDRVLTPEMMRAMIILYVGPHNRPDFAQDYLLSPILAPDLLLARFPKTYFLTGERDPLVDDTVIFAGRLRRVKAALYASGGRRVEYCEADARAPGFDDRDAAEVVLIPGVSHGFLQFPAVYPPAWKWFQRSAQWIEDAFSHAEKARSRNDASAVSRQPQRGRATSRAAKQAQVQAGIETTKSPSSRANPPPVRAHSATRTESSGDEAPLEMMRMTKAGRSPPTAAANNGSGIFSEADAKRNTAASSHTTESATSAAVSAPKPSAASSVADPNSGSGSAKARIKKQRETARQRAKHDSDLIKLKSTDDLLGRRMQGIVGGLTGMAEE
ncbi:hypothetical protein SEPCBS119000_005251 [Sporothrix epigloea]|uniref:Alpha/beta hydrolase fold-3 domain-containing protein n=1 Tax=Sporothrix epigloea TaxID=1892477 RepID=A0ABP0DWL3_9PEZI